MAGCAAAGQRDSGRRREGASDAARRGAPHFFGRGDAVWLRRVHPPRDLAGDAASDSAEQALAPGDSGQRGGGESPPLSLVASEAKACVRKLCFACRRCEAERLNGADSAQVANSAWGRSERWPCLAEQDWLKRCPTSALVRRGRSSLGLGLPDCELLELGQR